MTISAQNESRSFEPILMSTRNITLGGLEKTLMSTGNTKKESGPSRERGQSLKNKSQSPEKTAKASDMSQQPSNEKVEQGIIAQKSNKKGNPTEKSAQPSNEIGSDDGNHKLVKEILDEAKMEFKKGFAKLLGWTIPVLLFGTIFTFAFTFIGNVTWKNELKVENMIFTPTDNMVYTGESNFTRFSVHHIGEPGEIVGDEQTFSYSYNLELTGHGKIESADILYSSEERNELHPIKIEIQNKIVGRAFNVNPSELRFQVTYYKSGEDIKRKKKIAYLALKDDQSGSVQIYVLVISEDDDGKVEWMSEEEFLRLAPNDQTIDDPDDKRYYFAYNKEEIQEDLLYIRNIYSK